MLQLSQAGAPVRQFLKEHIDGVVVYSLSCLVVFQATVLLSSGFVGNCACTIMLACGQLKVRWQGFLAFCIKTKTCKLHEVKEIWTMFAA